MAYGEKAFLTFWKKDDLRFLSAGVAGVEGAVLYAPSVLALAGVPSTVSAAPVFLGVVGGREEAAPAPDATPREEPVSFFAAPGTAVEVVDGLVLSAAAVPVTPLAVAADPRLARSAVGVDSFLSLSGRMRELGVEEDFLGVLGALPVAGTGGAVPFLEVEDSSLLGSILDTRLFSLSVKLLPSFLPTVLEGVVVGVEVAELLMGTAEAATAGLLSVDPDPVPTEVAGTVGTVSFTSLATSFFNSLALALEGWPVLVEVPDPVPTEVAGTVGTVSLTSLATSFFNSAGLAVSVAPLPMYEPVAAFGVASRVSP